MLFLTVVFRDVYIITWRHFTGYIWAVRLTGGLANRVKRKDTLALKLERQEREEREVQENHDSMSWNNREQWEELRNRIGTTLNRYGAQTGRFLLTSSIIPVVFVFKGCPSTCSPCFFS